MNLEKALPSNLIISQSTLVLIIFLLYTLSFSLVIPAYPKLLLNLNHDNSATASLTYGMVSSLRYLLEFFSNQYLGLLSDRIGRKPILIT
jgi:MFS family permease